MKYDDAWLEKNFGSLEKTEKTYTLKAWGRTFENMTKPQIESLMEDEYSSVYPVSFRGSKVIVDGQTVGTIQEA